MGHFNDTLMAVCSTLSSPFRVVFPAEAATLLKFLLTTKTSVSEERYHFVNTCRSTSSPNSNKTQRRTGCMLVLLPYTYNMHELH